MPESDPPPPNCLGFLGQTWFISCLFFMKLRPQKWQVPVLRVMPDPAEPDEEELPVLLGKISNVFTKNLLCMLRFSMSVSKIMSRGYCYLSMGVLVLGSRVGSTLLLTSDRGGGLRNSSATLSQVLLMYYDLVILIFPHPGRVA